VWAAVSALALAMGPVIGGILVGYADWRAIFWFNLGVGAVAFAMALAFVPESSDPTGRRFDYPGVALGVIALGAMSAAIIQGEVSGYGSRVIEGLFGLAAVAAVAFVVVERRAKDPIINLHYFRRPAFVGSNYVAFATYFGTFSIFFFTALYLEVVGTATPYRIALDFLPMAVGMILASVFTGRWVARSGPRLPMTVGCVLAGTGVLLTNVILSPTVAYLPLAGTLALCGVGFGIAMVPVTSTALSLVPPEHSGMAASTTNTSRELGAVVGVAVLGSLVNAQLTGGLASRLRAIGIPPKFFNLVISAVTQGGLPSSGGSSTKSSNQAIQKTINEVVNAAYSAFGRGLHISLVVSGIMILTGAVVAATTIRWRHEVYEA
jgi:predicted MFS family arabinose efflux permease